MRASSAVSELARSASRHAEAVPAGHPLMEMVMLPMGMRGVSLLPDATTSDAVSACTAMIDPAPVCVVTSAMCVIVLLPLVHVGNWICAALAREFPLPDQK